MTETNQYTKVFSRICHITALTKDGKAQQVVDDLVVTSLYLYGGEHHYNESNVADAIKNAFGLDLNPAVLGASIDRQIDAGKLIRDASTHAIVLSAEVEVEVRERVDSAALLERQVRDAWIDSIDILDEPLTDAQKFQLWEALNSFLSKLFQRHGATTIGLLGPKLEDNDLYGKGKARLLRDAVRECCDEELSSIAHQALPTIFESPTADVVRFLTQLLDGTFSFFAVSTDIDTTRYLNRVLSPLSIFLDTNFIFGLLSLQGSSFSTLSDELIETIKKGRFPFTLYCHEETVNEFQSTIHYYSKELMGRHWKAAISRAAAANATALSGIEKRYHEVNSEAPISAEVFFSRYRKLAPLLKPYKCQIWEEPKRRAIDTQALQAQINDYALFLSDGNKTKMGPALQHDMAVFSTVSSMKNESSSILEAGALLLTTDYSLYSYDNANRKPSDPVGSVVMPNHLLQLLRPLVPHSGDADKHFVNTFSMPEFRTTGGDYAGTQRNVLSYLNIYSDLPSETAARLLADEMLLAQLQTPSLDDEAFHELIDQALAEENSALQAELEELAVDRERQSRELEQKTQLADEAQSNIVELQAEVRKRNHDLDTLTSEIEETKARARDLQRITEESGSQMTRYSADMKNLNTQLEETKAISDIANRKIDYLRKIVALLLVFSLGTLMWFQPLILPISWLDQHAKNVAIRIVLFVFAISIGLWIAFPKFHKLIWLPLVLVLVGSLISFFT